MKVDEIDLKIVEVLEENGRMTNNELATRLKISEGTVRNRVKKLLENNYLSIRGHCNPELVKKKLVIFLGIKILGNKDLEKTAIAISKLPSVKSVSMVTGRYDIFAELFIKPIELVNFLRNELAKLSAVISTESFISLKNFNKWV
jgi:Lrp/AsnC family transcriptional regulator, regulator for asnA, asnC and gidA